MSREGRRASAAQDAFMNPTTIPTHRGSLDLSPPVDDQEFGLTNSLAFTGSLPTTSTLDSQSEYPQSLCINPRYIETGHNTYGPQPGTGFYSFPPSFDHQNLAHHLKHPLQVEHGAPWNPVAAVDQSMTYPNQQPVSTARQPKHKQPTDSGYASSLKSAPIALSHSYMATDPTDAQLNRIESRESRMQQVLPDQSSTFTRKISQSKAKAKTVIGIGENIAQRGELSCDRCDLQFSTPSEYNKHMARHTKSFKCIVEGCKKTDGFSTKNDLERHLFAVHGIGNGAKDQVWKCFVEGCKTYEKLWPRRDNFKAHIKRMHEEVDFDEYLRISETWFADEEQPRRRQAEADAQAEFAADLSLPANIVTGTQDLDAGNDQYANNMAALSPAGDFNSRHSIAGEFPYTGLNTHDSFDHVSGFEPQSVAMSFPQHGSTLGVPDQVQNIGQAFSNNANTSMSSNLYRQAASTIPAIHADDIQEQYNQIGIYSQNQSAGAWDRQTMPDMSRVHGAFQYNYNSVLEADNYDGGISPLPQEDNSLFQHMGPQYDPSLPLPNAISQVITELPHQPTTTPSIVTTPNDQIDHAEELRMKVAEVMNSVGADSELALKLLKVVEEHSSSRTSTSTEEERPFACDWKNCQKRFAKKNVCAKHRKRHEKRWFCTFDNCYKAFGSKQDMQRHEFTCRTQEEGWRCWSRPESKATNKECAKFFTDFKAFEKHAKEHHYGYTRRDGVMDGFKVERDFAGLFWCGFCNMVVPNPVHGSTNGTARLKWRYDHIDKHLNEEGKTMADWYDLKGEGKTKLQRFAASDKSVTTPTNGEDDDGLDDDEGDDVSHATAPPFIRRRQRSETIPSTNSRHLAPPPNTFVQGTKRRLPDEDVSGHHIQTQKMLRTGHFSTAPRQSFGPSQSISPEEVAMRANDRTIGFVKCCECFEGAPRSYDRRNQCLDCGHRICANCKYWNRYLYRLNVKRDND